MAKRTLLTIFTSCLALISFNLYSQAAPWVGLDLSGVQCMGERQGVGPLDYTKPAHRNSNIFGLVVGAHFNADVRTLRKGQSADTPAGDLDYTLRGIPNHHVALDSMMRYQFDKNNQTDLKRKEIPSTLCYLQRAINFAPEDYVPHMLLGIWYTKHSLPNKALDAYKRAEKNGSDSSQLNYNMGLLYLKMGQLDNALLHAKRAYAKKYPFDGLKNKLIKLDVWK